MIKTFKITKITIKALILSVNLFAMFIQPVTAVELEQVPVNIQLAGGDGTFCPDSPGRCGALI